MMAGAAKFQREKIFAAILAAYVQGMRYDDIRAGLLSFFPSPSLTPGRLNLMRFGNGRVLVDYAHNAAAIAGLMEFVQGLDANRRVGILRHRVTGATKIFAPPAACRPVSIA
jgi:UDP-N-acetylmuramyl tripeptide synthase